MMLSEDLLRMQKKIVSDRIEFTKTAIYVIAANSHIVNSFLALAAGRKNDHLPRCAVTSQPSLAQHL